MRFDRVHLKILNVKMKYLLSLIQRNYLTYLWFDVPGVLATKDSCGRLVCTVVCEQIDARTIFVKILNAI